MNDESKDTYVDWSKAPEGTTQVVASTFREDGTPYQTHNWEKVVGDYIYMIGGRRLGKS